MMEKEPRDVFEALKFVRTSAANQQAMFGVKTQTFGQRQVSFANEDDEYATRTVTCPSPPSVLKKVGQDDSISRLEDRLNNRINDGFNEVKSLIKQ